MLCDFNENISKTIYYCANVIKLFCKICKCFNLINVRKLFYFIVHANFCLKNELEIPNGFEY